MFKPTIPNEYYNDMTDQSTPEKRRGRFSRFLDNKKEKDKGVPPPMNTNNSHTNTDSAYASSENDPTRKATPDFVQVNNHEIPGVDQDRHLWLDKNNGEIYDEDTGDIVTTVTTTTTTTTTTTSRGGRKQEVVDVKTTQTEPMRQNADNTTGPTLGQTAGQTTSHTTGSLPPKQTGGLNEMPANTAQPATVHMNTAVPTYGGSSSGSSFMPTATGPESVNRPPTDIRTETRPTMDSRTDSAHAPIPIRTDSSPPIPNKHPGRVSGEYSRTDVSEYENVHPAAAGPVSPITPTRHNFSYPSRAGPGPGATEEPGVARSGSTFANLKAAAIAAHGIGETLRGTLNEAVDSRYPRKDAAKSSAVNSKNQAAIERGRAEMGEFGSFRHQNTANPNVSHTGQGVPHSSHTEPLTSSAAGTTTTEPRYHPPTGTALGSHPPNDPVETDSRPAESKSSGFGKLFKRKPLASENQGQPAKYF